MPAKLKNGVVGAPGGEREGAGRKPDWLKAAIEEIGDPLKVIQYLYDVNQGIEKETLVVGETTIKVPAPVKDRIRAGEAYLDRRMGKVPQALDVTNRDETDRPSTDALIQTMSALRSELDALRKGTSVEAGK